MACLLLGSTLEVGSDNIEDSSELERFPAGSLDITTDPGVTSSYNIVGSVGSRPCVRKAGLYPVESDTLALMASAISGNSPSQELWSPSVSWAIIVLTVRFVLSVGFSCGQYGAVYWISTPIVWKYSFKMRLGNWVPLSQTNFRGMPTRPSIRSRNAFWTWAAVAFRNGINSTHLDIMKYEEHGISESRPR